VKLGFWTRKAAVGKRWHDPQQDKLPARLDQRDEWEQGRALETENERLHRIQARAASTRKLLDRGNSR